MASIGKEIHIAARREAVWDAISDVAPSTSVWRPGSCRDAHGSHLSYSERRERV